MMMIERPHLSEPFERIIATIDEGGSQEFPVHQSDDVDFTMFASVLADVILPRRINLRSKSGARLSVVAKNRRVIKVAEVHPEANWHSEQTPQETECVNDYDAFARPFSIALLKTVADDTAAIEQTFLTDPIGRIKNSGYPASALLEHIAQARRSIAEGRIVREFFDSCEGLPRAICGRDTVIDVPKDTLTREAWLKDRAADLETELAGKSVEFKVFEIDGQTPCVVALVWLGDAGCIAVSEVPEKFDLLVQRVDELRDHS